MGIFHKREILFGLLLNFQKIVLFIQLIQNNILNTLKLDR